MPIEDIISIETQIEKVETRLGDQMNSGVEVFDVKVDLMQLMNQQIHIERNEKKAQLTHKFHFEDIEEQDALILQVPNINESGYYSGIVALKSYVDKFSPDLKVAIIDPVIDYFFLNRP